MDLEIINNRLSKIENLLIGTKEVLNFDEVAAYTGLSKSYLYKLTSTGQIAHYKPKGKMLYFNKTDVDLFLKQNRVATQNEIETEATNYVTLKKK
jgi:excisionase family DNA binding protein